MAGATRYLLNRDGRYFARMTIPRRLRQWLEGKTEFREALGPDRRIALRRLSGAVATMQAKIVIAKQKEAESSFQSKGPCLYPLTPKDIAVRHYLYSLANDEEYRQDWRYASIGWPDESFVALLRDGMSGKLRDDQLQTTIGHLIARYNRLGNFSAEFGTRDWREVARALCAAEFESLSRTVERDEGNFGGKPDHPLLADLSEPEIHSPVDLQELWDNYVLTRQQIGSMRDGGRRQGLAVRSLIDFVGHHDAARMTRKDLLTWRDHLTKIISAQTISKVYLPTIHSLLRWAVDNDHLTENPAEGVKQVAPKIFRTRERGYTEGEAEKQLQACLRYQPLLGANGRPLENSKTTATKRWVPLLCAFTGARIAEITQARREDLRQEKDVNILRITPAAGAVKTNDYRDIPLHPQLVALGFIDYVDTVGSGPLFHMSKDPKQFHRHARKMGDRLRDWLHEGKLVPEGLQPCHGWRHRFKTIGVELGIAERILDCLQGHASKTAGERYGDITMKAKVDAIQRFPKLSVELDLLGKIDLDS